MKRLSILFTICLGLLSCGGPESSEELNEFLDPGVSTPVDTDNSTAKDFNCESGDCPQNITLIKNTKSLQSEISCTGLFVEENLLLTSKSCLKSLDLDSDMCPDDLIIKDLSGISYTCENLYVSEETKELVSAKYSQVVIKTKEKKLNFSKSPYYLENINSDLNLKVWYANFNPRNSTFDLSYNSFCKISAKSLRAFKINSNFQTRSLLLKNCPLDNVDNGGIITTMQDDIIGVTYRKLKEETKLNTLLSKRPKSLYLFNSMGCLLKNMRKVVPGHNGNEYLYFSTELILGCDQNINFDNRLDKESFYLKKIFNISGSSRKVYFVRDRDEEEIAFFEVRYPGCIDSREAQISSNDSTLKNQNIVPFFKVNPIVNEFFEVSKVVKSTNFTRSKFRMFSVFDNADKREYRVSFIAFDNIVDTVRVPRCF